MDSIIRLLEWLGQIWTEHLSPICILRDYEAGMLLRLGKRIRPLRIGLNWKLPLIDEVHTCNKVPDTFHVNSVPVTTVDGKSISVEPIVEYEIFDEEKYLLDFNDSISNIHDLCRGVIADYLTDCDWETVKDKKTLTAIKNKLKKECDRMGVKILSVYFGAIIQTRALTLFKDI